MREKRNSYEQFSLEERLIAYPMRRRGVSLRKICEALGRPESAAGSLSREFNRNEPRSPIVKQQLDPFERARYANEKALERLRIPRKNFKLESDIELKTFVDTKLGATDDASPQDISWRVKREMPGKSISHTAIYDYTKRNRSLIQKLRRKGKPNRQRITARKKPKDKSVQRRNISERTPLAEQGIEPGHFQVDTIHSLRGGSNYAILTIRELLSRMCWFFLIGDLKAETALAVVRGFLTLLPPHMRKTLTADNGPENAELHRLEALFRGFKVYYCDPYAAWQRGSVENANGLFRWYYPKGTDFKDVPRAEIWTVQDKINRRCMDCLGGRPSEEVFQQLVQNPPLIQLADAKVLSSREALREAVSLRFEQSSNLYLPSQAQSG